MVTNSAIQISLRKDDQMSQLTEPSYCIYYLSMHGLCITCDEYYSNSWHTGLWFLHNTYLAANDRILGYNFMSQVTNVRHRLRSVRKFWTEIKERCIPARSMKPDLVPSRHLEYYRLEDWDAAGRRTLKNRHFLRARCLRITKMLKINFFSSVPQSYSTTVLFKNKSYYQFCDET